MLYIFSKFFLFIFLYFQKEFKKWRKNNEFDVACLDVTKAYLKE